MSGSDDDHPAKRKQPPNGEISRIAKVPKTAPSFQHPDSLVSFIVGKDKTKFRVHKENVCQYSCVLRTAFNGQFVEGQTQTYTLEDIDPDVFRMAVKYFYRQDLDFPKFSSEKEREQYFEHSNNLVERDDKHLAQIWVLADKFMMPELQNMVAKRIVTLRNFDDGCVPTSTFAYIYKNTAMGSQLRRLAVHSSSALESDAFVDSRQIYPKQFLLEFAHFLKRVGEGKDADIGDELVASDYYVPVE